MMPAFLKALIRGFVLHFCMQLTILLQVKIYDAYIIDHLSDILLLTLPILIGVIAYNLFKPNTMKGFWFDVFAVFLLTAVFVVLGNSFGYFSTLFNLFMGHDSYELGGNAMIGGILDMISVFIIFFIQHIRLSKKLKS